MFIIAELDEFREFWTTIVKGPDPNPNFPEGWILIRFFRKVETSFPQGPGPIFSYQNQNLSKLELLF